MKTLSGNICQSCGRPIRKISHFGTYEDGSVHTDYCRFCYKDGQFLDPGVSMEEKIKKSIERAVLSGISEDIARKNAMQLIPELKRWRRVRKKRRHEAA